LDYKEFINTEISPEAKELIEKYILIDDGCGRVIISSDYPSAITLDSNGITLRNNIRNRPIILSGQFVTVSDNNYEVNK